MPTGTMIYNKALSDAIAEVLKSKGLDNYTKGYTVGILKELKK